MNKQSESYLQRNFRAEYFASAIFSVESLSFSWKGQAEHKILDNLDFALFAGQCLGLVGANGCGKTTFFRCITGLLKPQTGHVRLAGRVLHGEADFHDLRCNVGYVLQDADDQLFFPTLLEDISFGPINLGLKADAARKRALAALEQVGLHGFADRLSYRLSGGEKKLAAIAAILAMKPKAILLDEPLSGLDVEASQRIANVIMGLDCAKLIISHNYSFLRSLDAKCIKLEDGKLHPCALPL